MSDGLTALPHLHDYLWLAQFFSLLVLPFAHDDLAITFGAYVVVNKIMPVGLVALCIYGGMVASDFVLYGIGVGARHLPWLTRLAVDDRVRSFADTAKRNLFGLVALCRVVPGVVFIAFVACGWSRVPLARFTVASLVVSALYLPLMLCIAVFFADALDGRVGFWTWPFLLCVLAAIGFVRRQVFGFQQSPAPAEGEPSAQDATRDGHRAVRIPAALFYLPLVLSWIWLGLRHRSLTLPTVANPRDALRALRDESKSDHLLDVAARRWIADFVVLTRSAAPRTLYTDLERARQALCSAELAFPLVAMPDVGRRGACRIDDISALRDYLRQFRPGEKLILQRFVPCEGEASVLYARLPGAQHGRILSLLVRTGDGYRDGRRYITPKLEARLDAIAQGMREFHYGRFDLRFASADELVRGEGFSIVDIKGIGRGANEVWDASLPFAEIYRRLIDRQRIMFLIGEKNRARGFEPVGCAGFLTSMVRQSQLGRRYPASA